MSDDRWSAGWFPLPRRHFLSPEQGGSALWHKRRVYSEYEAWLYLWTKAAWGAREHAIGGGILDLETGETPPLAIRTLMKDWGWKSIKRVHGFVQQLIDRNEIRVSKTTKNGNTYLFVNPSPRRKEGNATETHGRRTGDAAETTSYEVEKERNSPLRGESREGGSENGTAPRKRAAPKPLPDEWLPNEKHRTACEAAHIDLAALVLDFRTYWRDDVNGTKTNWDLTFTKRIAAVRSTGKFRLNGKSARFVPDEASLSEIGEKIRFRTGEGDENVPWH